MRTRTAKKVLNTRNYFDLMLNPENGKTCFVPRSSKHVNLVQRACAKLHDWTLIQEMNAAVKEAFAAE